jgi:hypothetical protein
MLPMASDVTKQALVRTLVTPGRASLAGTQISAGVWEACAIHPYSGESGAGSYGMPNEEPRIAFSCGQTSQALTSSNTQKEVVTAINLANTDRDLVHSRKSRHMISHEITAGNYGRTDTATHLPP